MQLRYFPRTLVTIWLFSRLLASYVFFGLFVRPLIKDDARRKKLLFKIHQKNAVRLFDAFCKLGGIFVKIGQFLSTQIFLPTPYLIEMAKMQDRVPRTDFVTIEAHLRKIYPDYDQRFEKIEPVPLASASIGQVHRVHFKDGRDGVIKVKYPGLDPWFLHDLEVIEKLVPIFVAIIELVYYGERTSIDHRKTLGEFAKYLRFELDYDNEQRNQEKFYKILRNYRGIIVPEIYSEHCRPGVITMQYIDGRSALRFFLDDQVSMERKHATYELLLESGVYTLLHFGIFQADPHPGNYMIGPNDELVMLDFGCVKELPEKFYKGIGDFIGGFLMKDTHKVSSILYELGFRTKRDSVESIELWVKFAFERLSEVFEHFDKGTNVIEHLKKNLSTTAADIYHLDKEHRVDTVPEEYVMLGRALGTPPIPYNKYQPKVNVVGLAMRNLPPMRPSAIVDDETAA